MSLKSVTSSDSVYVPPQIGVPEDDLKLPFTGATPMLVNSGSPLLDQQMVNSLEQAKALGLKPWMVEHRNTRLPFQRIHFPTPNQKKWSPLISSGMWLPIFKPNNL